jgi:hypothetical protein
MSTPRCSLLFPVVLDQWVLINSGQDPRVDCRVSVLHTVQNTQHCSGTALVHPGQRWCGTQTGDPLLRSVEGSSLVTSHYRPVHAYAAVAVHPCPPRNTGSLSGFCACTKLCLSEGLRSACTSLRPRNKNERRCTTAASIAFSSRGQWESNGNPNQECRDSNSVEIRFTSTVTAPCLVAPHASSLTDCLTWRPALRSNGPSGLASDY